MTAARGIVAAGAYAPPYRIPAEAFKAAWGRFDAPGVETKAVADADEDALTMAVEAARRALSAGDASGADVDVLAFASTTPPLEEEDLTPRLGSYLDVPAGTTRRFHGGSTRAGVDALLDALDAAGTALIVAADCPRGEPDDPREHAAGVGAAAFLVGDDAVASVVDRAAHADPRPGTRFRRRGEGCVDGLDIGSYGRAAYVEPVEAAVDGLDEASAESVDAVALQAPDGKLPYRTRFDAEAVSAVETVSELGDTGAAGALLSLATALDAGHERVLTVGWGSGAGASALVVEGTAPVERSLEARAELDYPAYLRRRGEIVGEKPDGGAAHVPVPTWRRRLPQRYRLEAGRCPACGEIAFPPGGACPGCREFVEYEPVEPASGAPVEVTSEGFDSPAADGLDEAASEGTGSPAPEGTVEAATTIGQGGAPPEFAEQVARQGAFGVAIVRFEVDDGDGSFSVPMQVVGEVEPGETAAGETMAGDAVRAVPRRIYLEEGVPRYGLKALPR